MRTILLIGVILECLILLALALAKKCTGKAFVILSLVTAICCGTVAAVDGLAGSGAAREADTAKSHVYMAVTFMRRQEPDNALKALGQITEAEGKAYGANGLRALAYNRTGTFFAGQTLLQEASEEDLVQLRTLCAGQKTAPEDLGERIIAAVEEKLDLSEGEKDRFEALRKLLYGIDGADSDAGTPIAQIKASAQAGDWDQAYALATQAAEEGNLADAILVSEMYVRDYSNRRLATEDAAYDTLLQEATALQVSLNRVGQYGTDNREYEETYAAYRLAMLALNRESALRAVNYLNAFYERDSVYDIAYQLQLAKLYYEANERELARAALDAVFTQKEPDRDQWLAVDVILLREAYLDGMGNMTNPQFDSLLRQLMGSLYQDVLPGYGSDSFSDFLHLYLQELYGGIYIGKPDLKAYPQVTLTVSVDEDIPFSADTVRLTDTDREVENVSIVPEEKTVMSVCFVLDRSGSMGGTFILSAKQSIREFASSMDADTRTGLVSFESTARVDCPMMDSGYMVAAQVDKINAYGGTNIASGLLLGSRQLEEAQGKKIIILLSDGVDGNASSLPHALRQLQDQGVIVHAVGLPGCDEQYLSRIAEETGGTYFPAVSAASLSSVYDQIRGFIRNSYLVTYQAEEEAVTERMVRVESTETMAQTRRAYTTAETQQQYSQVEDRQATDYFQQIGGTAGGY